MKPPENPYSIPAEVVAIGSVHFWSSEIGEHTHPEMTVQRRIGMGLGKMFGLGDLKAVQFQLLANQVLPAYRAFQRGENADCARDEAWPTQFQALESWVDRGIDGIYAMSKDIPDDARKEKYIWVFRHDGGRLELRQGSHRCLALWILGERDVWAKVTRPE